MQFSFLSLQCFTDSTVIPILSQTPSGNALNSVVQIKVKMTVKTVEILFFL